MKLHSNRIYTPEGPKAGVLTVEGSKITAFAGKYDRTPKPLNTATSGSSPAF